MGLRKRRYRTRPIEYKIKAQANSVIVLKFARNVILLLKNEQRNQRHKERGELLRKPLCIDYQFLRLSTLCFKFVQPHLNGGFHDWPSIYERLLCDIDMHLLTSGRRIGWVRSRRLRQNNPPGLWASLTGTK